MNRVVVLVDGFNLYYSVCEAVKETGASLKWLDLRESDKLQPTQTFDTVSADG